MRTKNRWLVLAVCCLINLCVGSMYAWSVFAAPMEAHLNQVMPTPLAAGAISIVFTVSQAVGPVSMILGGKVNDKMGPKLVLLTGGLMFGAGQLIAGFAVNLGMLILGYGVLSGLAAAMIYGCNVSTAVKYFPEKRGLIGGVATASYGISSVIISKVSGALIESQGVTVAFKTLGVVYLIIICGGALLIGQKKGKNSGSAAALQVTEKDKNWKQMLSTGEFYLMMAILLCGAVSGMMCISQASVVAQNMMHMTAAAAATVVAVLALFNAGGRIAAGFLSDHIGRTATLILASVVSMAGLFLLIISEQQGVWLFMAGISMVGIYFGTFMGVFPGFTTDAFGLAYNSVNYGILFIGFALAGFAGPTIISKIYAATGAYKMAFAAAAGCSVLGIVLLLIYRKRYEGRNRQ